MAGRRKLIISAIKTTAFFPEIRMDLQGLLGSQRRPAEERRQEKFCLNPEGG
jgi:hypothetical protein